MKAPTTGALQRVPMHVRAHTHMSAHTHPYMRVHAHANGRVNNCRNVEAMHKTIQSDIGRLNTMDSDLAKVCVCVCVCVHVSVAQIFAFEVWLWMGERCECGAHRRARRLSPTMYTCTNAPYVRQMHTLSTSDARHVHTHCARTHACMDARTQGTESVARISVLTDEQRRKNRHTTCLQCGAVMLGLGFRV